MEKDPNDEKDSQGHVEEEDHPGNVEGPGNVTVDEPTDTSLSGTSADDFTGGGDPNEESDS